MRLGLHWKYTPSTRRPPQAQPFRFLMPNDNSNPKLVIRDLQRDRVSFTLEGVDISLVCRLHTVGT